MIIIYLFTIKAIIFIHKSYNKVQGFVKLSNGKKQMLKKADTFRWNTLIK